MAEARRFQGLVAEAGSRVVLVLPFNPNDVWGLRQRHHVSGTVDGQGWRGPVEHDGDRFFLALGPAWRERHGVAVGASLEGVLAPEGPLADNIGADVAAALAAEPEALAFFEGLPTFYRRNYMRWIDGAKRPETRAARIGEAVRMLRAGLRR